MYTTELIQYLLWPAFIIAAWIVIRLTLKAYEKKYPERPSDSSPEKG